MIYLKQSATGYEEKKIASAIRTKFKHELILISFTGRREQKYHLL